MKRLRTNKSASARPTRRGAASLYVVVFTTILLGIITLSFIRVMLSEARRTSNNDLSQSAYDSALAGIEDAKVALLKYHDCISQGKTANSSAPAGSCEKLIDFMQKGIKDQSCDVVADTLRRFRGEQGEVIIQETQEGVADKGIAASMQQAYTCVKIGEELPDYRSTLDSNNRIRMVPLRTKNINDVKSVKVSWFSDVNQNGDSLNFMTPGSVSSSNTIIFKPGKTQPREVYKPPVLAVQLLQTDQQFNLNELVYNSTSSGTNRGTVVLYPYFGSSDNGVITAQAGFLASNDKADNAPYPIKCKSASQTSTGFACSVVLNLPPTFRNSGNRNVASSFLRLSLPYGQPTTDFSIALCSDNECRQNANVNFVGVQTAIDSTGRANDLYRRVETRVELVDVNYPFPEFTLSVEDKNGTTDTRKNFWITRECWTSDNGSVDACGNNNAD